MALVVKRNGGETWRDAVLRLAAPYGLEGEVGDAYDEAKSGGACDENAALDAAIEWDVAEFEDWSDAS